MQRPLSEGRGARGLGNSGPGPTPQVLRLGWCTPEPGRPSPSRSVSFEAENRPRRCTGRPGEAWAASGDTLLPAALAPPRIPAEPPTPSRVPGLAGSSGPPACSGSRPSRGPSTLAWTLLSAPRTQPGPQPGPVLPGDLPQEARTATPFPRFPGAAGSSLGPSRRPGPKDEDAAAALREPPRPRAARGPKPAREDGGEGSPPGSAQGRRRPAAPRSPRSPPPPAACPGHTDTRLSLAGRSPGRTEDRRRTPPSPCRGGLGEKQRPAPLRGRSATPPLVPHLHLSTQAPCSFQDAAAGAPGAHPGPPTPAQPGNLPPPRAISPSLFITCTIHARCGGSSLRGRNWSGEDPPRPPPPLPRCWLQPDGFGGQLPGVTACGHRLGPCEHVNPGPRGQREGQREDRAAAAAGEAGSAGLPAVPTKLWSSTHRHGDRDGTAAGEGNSACGAESRAPLSGRKSRISSKSRAGWCRHPRCLGQRSPGTTGGPHARSKCHGTSRKMSKQGDYVVRSMFLEDAAGCWVESAQGTLLPPALGAAVPPGGTQPPKWSSSAKGVRQWGSGLRTRPGCATAASHPLYQQEKPWRQGDFGHERRARGPIPAAPVTPTLSGRARHGPQAATREVGAGERVSAGFTFRSNVLSSGQAALTGRGASVFHTLGPEGHAWWRTQDTTRGHAGARPACQRLGDPGRLLPTTWHPTLSSAQNPPSYLQTPPDSPTLRPSSPGSLGRGSCPFLLCCSNHYMVFLDHGGTRAVEACHRGNVLWSSRLQFPPGPRRPRRPPPARKLRELPPTPAPQSAQQPPG
ncbi:collagen alpha-1(II) chain-like [Canis lupus dingo]|uniref:collagen alpha-1(II) chain-like n=1 Tax=Canis lupus dingo TaxID=286419 RepID=UPI0020C557C0|nr:collagen alpha-1(II) chain-like [Canis lupus dingo]